MQFSAEPAAPADEVEKDGQIMQVVAEVKLALKNPAGHSTHDEEATESTK